MKTRRGDETFGLHPSLDIRHNKEVSCTHWLHFTPKEIACCSLLLEAEWIPVLPNADRRNKPLEKFQRPYRESNPEPSLLHCPIYNIWRQCKERID